MTVRSPIVLALLAVLTGCQSGPHSAAAHGDTAAAAAAVRATDEAWAKAAATKQIDAWLSYYSPDVVVLPPNSPTLTKTTDVRALLTGLLALPDLAISWQATKIEVTNSGEVAYEYGTYSMSFTGPDGKKVVDTGKVLQIWKLQANGEWKCAVDGWSTDLPSKQ